MSEHLDQPWEDVTVTLYYQDGNKLSSKAFRVNRAEQEERERKEMLQAIDGPAYPEEDRDTAIKEAEAHVLSPADFRKRILVNAEHMVTSATRVPGAEPHEVRVLPPWAMREVRIEVHNLESRILTPS